MKRFFLRMVRAGLVRGAGLLALIALVAALAPVPSAAAPSGKLRTDELLMAGGFVAWFMAYESALVRSKGSVKQAEATMDATTQAHLSLQKVRGLVIADVANATGPADLWRDEFEDFRGCWNQTLSATTVPDSKSIAEQRANAQAAPVPSAKATLPAEKPLPCNALYAHVLDDIVNSPAVDKAHRVAALNARVDVLDLARAIAQSPSLFMQVQRKSVGSFASENYLRAMFLTIAAEGLTSRISGVYKESGSKGFTSTPIPDIAKAVLTNCATTLAVFPCVDAFGTIETALQTAQENRDACSWSRHAWMPTYSEIRTWKTGTGPFSRDFQPRFVGQVLPNAVVAMPETEYAGSKNSTVSALIDPIDRVVLGSPPGC